MVVGENAYVTPWCCCSIYDGRWSAYCWRSPEVLAAIFFGEWRWGVVDTVNLMIRQVPCCLVFLFTKWVVTCCIPRIPSRELTYPNWGIGKSFSKVPLKKGDITWFPGGYLVGRCWKIWSDLKMESNIDIMISLIFPVSFKNLWLLHVGKIGLKS